MTIFNSLFYCIFSITIYHPYTLFYLLYFLLSHNNHTSRTLTIFKYLIYTNNKTLLIKTENQEKNKYYKYTHQVYTGFLRVMPDTGPHWTFKNTNAPIHTDALESIPDTMMFMTDTQIYARHCGHAGCPWFHTTYSAKKCTKAQTPWKVFIKVTLKKRNMPNRLSSYWS